MLKHICSLAAISFVSLSSIALYAQTATTDLTSPDGSLALHFSTKAQQGSGSDSGKLVYSLTFHGKSVISDSALSLELTEGPPLGASVHIIGAEAGQGIDEYTLANQKTSKVHDAYSSLLLHLSEPSEPHRQMNVEARAYNGGIAFRYVLPEQNALRELKLKQENSEFGLATDATDWLLALPNYRSSYESEYVKLPTSALSNQGGVPSSFLIGLPLLMHEPGTAWLALMEADIEGSTTMYVTNPSGNWAGHWFVSNFLRDLIIQI